MKKHIVLLGAMLSVISAAAISSEALSTPESAIDFRQQQFKTLQDSFKQMNGMLRGSYDAAAVQAQATLFAEAAEHSLAGFQVAGSEQGDTKARPAVWSNWDDFEQRMLAFQSDAQTLSVAAASHDLAATKAAFGDAAKHCKACHRQYRMR